MEALRPTPEADKQALYLKSIDWYRLFGVSMQPVPPDRDAFQEYRDRNDILEDSRPVREGFRMHRTAPAPTLPGLSARANAVLGPYVVKTFLGYQAHRKSVHTLLLAIPDELHYFPLARTARQTYRETGVVAPLPLPPIDPEKT